MLGLWQKLFDIANRSEYNIYQIGGKYMNDIQFEAFSLYAGMRMDGMPKLDAFLYTIRCLLPEEEYPNGYDDSAVELYSWLRQKVKLDDV